MTGEFIILYFYLSVGGALANVCWKGNCFLNTLPEEQGTT